MDFTINGNKRSEGSISHGTLKCEDLIKSISDEVKTLCLVRPDILFEAECWMEGPQSYADNGFTEGFPNDTIEDVHESMGPSILHDLEGWLNNVAPEGIRFGSHEGDGSDIGWWGCDNE